MRKEWSEVSQVEDVYQVKDAFAAFWDDTGLDAVAVSIVNIELLSEKFFMGLSTRSPLLSRNDLVACDMGCPGLKSGQCVQLYSCDYENA